MISFHVLAPFFPFSFIFLDMGGSIILLLLKSKIAFQVAYGASYIEFFSEEAKRIYGDIIPAPLSDRRLFVLKQVCQWCLNLSYVPFNKYAIIDTCSMIYLLLFDNLTKFCFDIRKTRNTIAYEIFLLIDVLQFRNLIGVDTLHIGNPKAKLYYSFNNLM